MKTKTSNKINIHKILIYYLQKKNINIKIK